MQIEFRLAKYLRKILKLDEEVKMNDDEICTSMPDIPTPKNEIAFYPIQDGWAVKITPHGVILNKEFYADWKPDDFVKCFIDILEKNFTIKFYEKEKNE